VTRPARLFLLPLLPLLPAAITAAACGPPPADAVVNVPGAATAPALAEVAPSASISAEPCPAAPAAAIAWETSESVARERAKARGAPLLVFFFASWDATGVRMDRLTWKDPQVIKSAGSFVPLRIDFTETDANSELDADRFGVTAVPTTLLLDDAGNELERIVGFVEPRGILAAMARVTPGH
jgi:thiol:disulfide interchange protein DsbD